MRCQDFCKMRVSHSMCPFILGAIFLAGRAKTWVNSGLKCPSLPHHWWCERRRWRRDVISLRQLRILLHLKLFIRNQVTSHILRPHSSGPSIWVRTSGACIMGKNGTKNLGQNHKRYHTYGRGDGTGPQSPTWWARTLRTVK